MAEQTTCTCDQCGNDLSKTSNVVDYRLALVNQNIPNPGRSGTMLGVYPAIERDAHFCGVDCLRHWLNVNYPERETEYYGGKAWAQSLREQRQK